MTRSSAWIAGVLVVIGAGAWTAVAQTRSTDMAQAGIPPSGLGDAVDRDVAKVRDATGRFKTAAAAEAAGYKRVTDCVENQPAGAMGYHFQNNDLLDTTLDVGHPEVLVYEDAPDPAGIPGHAIVRVRACALNHLDLWQRRGLDRVTIPFPHISGADVAGEVVSIVEGKSTPGLRVMLQPGLSCGRCARKTGTSGTTTSSAPSAVTPNPPRNGSCGRR